LSVNLEDDVISTIDKFVSRIVHRNIIALAAYFTYVEGEYFKAHDLTKKLWWLKSALPEKKGSSIPGGTSTQLKNLSEANLVGQLIDERSTRPYYFLKSSKEFEKLIEECVDNLGGASEKEKLRSVFSAIAKHSEEILEEDDARKEEDNARKEQAGTKEPVPAKCTNKNLPDWLSHQVYALARLTPESRAAVCLIIEALGRKDEIEFRHKEVKSLVPEAVTG
jgi:hypothetical protein